MDCNNFNIKILNYIENSLSESENLEIKNHLEICSECEKKYIFLLKTENFITEEKNLKHNNFLATVIIAKIEKQTTRQKYFSRVLTPTLAVLVVFFGIVLGFNFAKYIGNNEQKVSQNELKNTDISDQYVINDISYNDYFFYSNQ